MRSYPSEDGERVDRYAGCGAQWRGRGDEQEGGAALFGAGGGQFDRVGDVDQGHPEAGQRHAVERAGYAGVGADPSYTTIIVNELQALGLLSRTPDAHDRRRKAVELTADGRAAMQKAQDIIARPPSALCDLPAADLTRLRNILGRLSRP
jgi:Winged helix DNA-binding domain